MYAKRRNPPPVVLTPEQIAGIASQIQPTDISGKVDKVTGHSLVADAEIVKIHSIGADNQDLSGLVVKVTGQSLVLDTEITKLSGLKKITISPTPPGNPQPDEVWIILTS